MQLSAATPKTPVQRPETLQSRFPARRTASRGPHGARRRAVSWPNSPVFVHRDFRRAKSKPGHDIEREQMARMRRATLAAPAHRSTFRREYADTRRCRSSARRRTAECRGRYADRRAAAGCAHRRQRRDFRRSRAGSGIALRDRDEGRSRADGPAPRSRPADTRQSAWHIRWQFQARKSRCRRRQDVMPGSSSFSTASMRFRSSCESHSADLDLELAVAPRDRRAARRRRDSRCRGRPVMPAAGIDKDAVAGIAAFRSSRERPTAAARALFAQRSQKAASSRPTAPGRSPWPPGFSLRISDKPRPCADRYRRCRPSNRSGRHPAGEE